MAIKHIILKEGTTQLYPNAAYPVGYIYMSTESFIWWYMGTNFGIFFIWI